jgi:hypothetical protein
MRRAIAMVMAAVIRRTPALGETTTWIATRMELLTSATAVRWMLITMPTVTGCVATTMPVPSMQTTMQMVTGYVEMLTAVR